MMMTMISWPRWCNKVFVRKVLTITSHDTWINVADDDNDKISYVLCTIATYLHIRFVKNHATSHQLHKTNWFLWTIFLIFPLSYLQVMMMTSATMMKNSIFFTIMTHESMHCNVADDDNAKISYVLSKHGICTFLTSHQLHECDGQSVISCYCHSTSTLNLNLIVFYLSFITFSFDFPFTLVHFLFTKSNWS